MSDGIRHGTASGYSTHRCRCDECREYKRSKSAAYYLANRQAILARNAAWATENRDRASAAAKLWRARNPGAQAAATARWRAKNPDYDYAKVNPDRKKQIDARYRSSERAKEAQREWQRQNPERLAAYNRKWRTSNRVAASLNVRRCFARKRGAETCVFTKNDWLRMQRRFDFKCFYCGEVKPLTQDHLIPLARGGRHSIGNLVPACQQCNSSKNDRLLVEWKFGRKRRKVA